MPDRIAWVIAGIVVLALVPNSSTHQIRITKEAIRFGAIAANPLSNIVCGLAIQIFSNPSCKRERLVVLDYP